MKIRTFFSLADDVYKVSIYTQDWSEADNALMQRFGEPEINVGGEFTDPAFTLPDAYRNIKSESPFSQSFDYRDSTASEARALRWQEDMVTTITSAITTLRANVDDFTDEEVLTV